MEHVTEAVKTDASKIRELALESGIDAWSADDYADEIQRSGSFVLCIREGQRIIGFLVARQVPGAAEIPDAEIYNIAVSTGSRRSGIGSQLLSELTLRLRSKGVKDIWLEVRESNVTAIRFYADQGFTAEVTRPNFYSNPTENAVIMRLSLSESPDVNNP